MKRNNNNQIQLQSEAWLSEDLRKEVRRVFEPRYKRILSNEEIFEIANNLTEFMELIIEYKRSKNNKV
jgi:hypothetical protein